MTLILKRSDLAKNFITGGQDNVGVRVPAHPAALALLSEFEKLGGLGIAAPSANKFGAVSPTNSEAVIEEIGSELSQRDMILDGGNSNVGLESTIIDCTKEVPDVLRPGAITIEMIRFCTEHKIAISKVSNDIRASGLLKTHYSPKAQVVLGAEAKKGDGFLAMADISTPIGAIRLASPRTIEEFAHQLYQALRLGDHKNLTKIIVIPPIGGGLSDAIRDRLVRSVIGK
jgi:L-threonylcarbamoyladenylate synthase